MPPELILEEPAGGATADGRAEILHQFRLWNDALTRGDAAGVTALYGPGAVLVPTVSNTLRTTPGEIQAYFETLIRDKRPTATLRVDNVRFFGATAINSGIYTFHFRADGTSADARYTFAYHRTGSGWLISAHHSSLLYDEIVAGKAADPSF